MQEIGFWKCCTKVTSWFYLKHSKFIVEKCNLHQNYQKLLFATFLLTQCDSEEVEQKLHSCYIDTFMLQDVANELPKLKKFQRKFAFVKDVSNLSQAVIPL